MLLYIVYLMDKCTTTGLIAFLVSETIDVAQPYLKMQNLRLRIPKIGNPLTSWWIISVLQPNQCCVKTAVMGFEFVKIGDYVACHMSCVHHYGPWQEFFEVVHCSVSVLPA